jgi:hypothetical protein
LQDRGNAAEEADAKILYSRTMVIPAIFPGTSRRDPRDTLEESIAVVKSLGEAFGGFAP